MTSVTDSDIEDTSSVGSFHSCHLPDDDVDLDAGRHYIVDGDDDESAESSGEFVPASAFKFMNIPRLPSNVQISPPQHTLAKAIGGNQGVKSAATTGTKKNRRVVLDDDLTSTDDEPDITDMNLVEADVTLEDEINASSMPAYSSGDENTEDTDGEVERQVINSGKPVSQSIDLKVASTSSKKLTSSVFTFEFDDETNQLPANENQRKVDQHRKDAIHGERPKFIKNEKRGYWVLAYNDREAKSILEMRLPQEIGDFLYDYQRVGVEFLLSNWASDCGGAILADDMGMGKTNQAVAALAALFYSSQARRALVVVPLSVMDRWKSLMANWIGPHCYGGIQVFHGPRKDAALRQVAGEGGRGGVLLTTYETCQANVETLCKTKWDCLVVDEASKIKNHRSGLFKALRALASVSKRRACLTGTPFENSLAELWALFDFACDGKLLGSHEAFNRHFAGKIERSQLVGNAKNDIVMGTQLSKALHAVIAPYLLRREKTMFFSQSTEAHAEKARDKENTLVADAAEAVTATVKDIVQQPRLPDFSVRKIDVLVWVNLSTVQRDLYRSFLESEEVALALNKTQSPLAAITVLKKICDDPRLVSNRDGDSNAGKLKVLTTLLKELAVNGGHKVIVFSHSKRMIDFMELAIEQEYRRKRRDLTLSYLRVDGDLKVADRVRLIRSFNKDEPTGDRARDEWFDEKWDVLFLTSGVGALGIEVTGADRVIIFDPHWNPAVDDQAIDRAFRIGQKRNVVCYRFVTVGTVEEKMTRIQVRKTSLARTVLMAEAQKAYSTLDELRDLFTLGDPDSDDRLHRILQQYETRSIADTVKETLRECAKSGEIAEIVSQLEALSCEAQTPDEEDESSLRKLVIDGVVAGLSDRTRLFSKNDSELEGAMQEMTIDDKKAVNKVVEDAIGWLYTKEAVNVDGDE